MKRFENRIRNLESRLTAKAVVLHYADGRTRRLGGPKYFLGGLLAAAYRGAHRTPLQAEQLELIRNAVYAEEPGGGHLVELIKIMLAGADKDPTMHPELDAIG